MSQVEAEACEWDPDTGEAAVVAAVDTWPDCLAWPDEQVAAVERWLAEGGELPEVLRA